MIGFVFLIALGVGFATFFGGICAYFIKTISHKVNDAILSFAAGVMLAASVFNLILPSMNAKNGNIFITNLGIISGVLIIFLMDKVVNKIDNKVLVDGRFRDDEGLKKMILFVIAIAIHNFPEGLVVGVSFGNNDIRNAISLAIGISLQNIPEGFITIYPLIAYGVKKRKAFIIALFTGMSEVIGVMIGYFAINISAVLLPFLLALAGGTMLHVISHDMIPETHSHGFESIATVSLITGFIFMITINYFVAIV